MRCCSYRLLEAGAASSIEGVDDAAMFTRLKDAMRVLGFNERERQLVFGTLALILNLGNVTFQPDASKAAFLDRSTLAAVSSLF